MHRIFGQNYIKLYFIRIEILCIKNDFNQI